MSNFLKEVLGFLSFLVDFVINFVFGVINLVFHVAGNILETLLFLMPVEAIFFTALYLMWQRMDKGDGNEPMSFRSFIKTNKWVKMSFVVLTLGVVIVLAIKEGYLQGILLSIISLYN